MIFLNMCAIGTGCVHFFFFFFFLCVYTYCWSSMDTEDHRFDVVSNTTTRNHVKLGLLCGRFQDDGDFCNATAR